MWRVRGELEEAMWKVIAERLPERSRKHKALLPAIARRSALYTTERDELAEGPRVSENDDLAARALFFTLADAAKIGVPLAELAGRDALPASEPLRVLDVGAGCGAMSLGLLDFFAVRGLEREVAITAVDTDRDALAIMKHVVAQLGARCETAAGSVVRGALGDGTYDLAIAGGVLNELPEEAAVGVARDLLERITDDGAVILVEPATRELSRRLHRLRDAIIAGGGHVFAPCTRAAAPCPALADERDWCHEDRPFQPTPRLAALTRATGMRTKHLKFSYLVLRRAALSVSPAPGLLRVVSAAKKSKGKVELYVCGDEGRDKRRLQKRDRTPQTKPFERARRGDLLEVGENAYRVIDPTS